MATKELIIEQLKKLHSTVTDFSQSIEISIITVDPLVVSDEFLKTMCNLILDTNTNLEPIKLELETVYKQLQDLSITEFSMLWEELVQVYPFKKEYKGSLQELCNHKFVKTSLYKYLTSDKACVDQDLLNIVYMWLMCHTSYLQNKVNLKEKG